MPCPRDRIVRRSAAVGAVVLLAACGSGSREASSGNAPTTVTNCGAEVTLDKVPDRAVLLKSASVPFLADLGVLDHVVARAGLYPREYYDDATWAKLQNIPLLTDRTDAGGHLQISREEVISQRPDLVFGMTENLTRDTLSASKIPVLEEPAFCPDGGGRPGFDVVDRQMQMYGRVFHKETEAAKAIAALDKRVAAAKAKVPAGRKLTAAVLYPTPGGGVTYAYGSRSMATPQLQAAGLKNVFADSTERVFEVSREELIGRDPDVLILLRSDGSATTATKAVTSMKGASQINAVKNGRVINELLNFVEPPTPQAVTGLERLVDRLGDTK